MKSLIARIDESFNDQINEQSLNRVWQHVNSERPFALVSAFRGDRTYKENVKYNKDMAKRFRKLGYGYFFVDGYWIENEGTKDEQRVKEDTIFVIGNEGEGDYTKNKKGKFLKEIEKIVFDKKYEQEGIFFKTSNDRYITIDSNGDLDMEFEDFGYNRMGPVYTKLRDGKGKKFKFS